MQVLTRDDMLRSYACWAGVQDWIAEHCPDATAISVVTALRLADPEDCPYILFAAHLDGWGHGKAYGCPSVYEPGLGFYDAPGYGCPASEPVGQGHSNALGYGRGCTGNVGGIDDGQGVHAAYGSDLHNDGDGLGYGCWLGYGEGSSLGDGSGECLL